MIIDRLLDRLNLRLADEQIVYESVVRVGCRALFITNQIPQLIEAHFFDFALQIVEDRLCNCDIFRLLWRLLGHARLGRLLRLLRRWPRHRLRRCPVELLLDVLEDVSQL